jgi:uncharacterized membrane protein YphA (DoxX/SURF4 family)
MKSISDFYKWFDNHIDFGYSSIRIFLGTGLFIRGLLLFLDPYKITQLANATEYYWWFSYITIIHMIGGLFLVLGLFSRLASLIQIPILIGAVFYVHIGQGLLSNGQSLELATLVLVLLVVYMLFGPGKISVDEYLSKRS